MLELDGVSAAYGESQVLWDVSLAVPDSSVVALLGPNGAGKTTLLRTVSGLLRPAAGCVRLDGEDVTGWAPNRLATAGVCLIPEGRGVFRTLTVRENLVLHSPDVAEADAVERAVEAFPILGQRLSQRAGTLSGGEQQMLALARAYIGEPRLVLLDEVSMGLAPIIVDLIFEFITRLTAAGTSLLLVEQYVTRALDAAQYVYLMNRGRVAFAGEPAELQDEDVFGRYVGLAEGG